MSHTLVAAMLEVLLLLALSQLAITFTTGILKLLVHLHQQLILLESSLMMFGCLSFSVWSFLVSFYLLLQELEHIMELLLNLMKIFWFLLGKQLFFNIIKKGLSMINVRILGRGGDQLNLLITRGWGGRGMQL